MKKRIKRCAELLRKDKLCSLLVSNPLNITYLTGTPDMDGYLLVTCAQELFYFTNFLYRKQAKEIDLWRVILSDNKQNIFHLIAKTIKQLKNKKIGFEAKHLPFLEQKTIQSSLPGKNIKFLETSDFIEKMRMIKTRGELRSIKKSTSISMEAFCFVEEILGETMTEKHLAIEIEKFLRLKADNELAFATIVASGTNTVYPHYRPQEILIGNKNLLIDLGAKYCRYCADLTRIFFCSKMPTLFKKIHDTVRKAQELGIGKIKHGVKIAEVDKAAREHIEKKGWGKYFGHGLGHGIGLSVHEPPYLRPNNDEILQEGMVITVEPAIYFNNNFGIRIEDMILVKANGAEVLSGDSYR